MGNGASNARLRPRRVVVFLEGKPDVKMRVVVPGSWEEFVGAVQGKLGIPYSTSVKVTADGVECHALEELREGEVLCISPETTSDIGRTSSGRRVFSAKLAKETHTADFTTYAILGTAAARDFEVLQAVGGGHNGFVFKSRCRLGGLPDPSALFALKMVYNFGVGADMARRAFQNEFRVLSQLPPHKRITRFWCQFVDEIPDVVIPSLPEFAAEQAQYQEVAGGPVRRRLAQFLVMDFHPHTLRKVRARLPTPLPLKVFVQYAIDILDAAVHLEKHTTCHLDIKDDNVLVSASGHLAMCDFGTAVRFASREMRMPYMQGMSPGGNQQHLAPEVLSAFFKCEKNPAAGGELDYSHQANFAIGVLLYELALNTSPWPDYPDECRVAGSHEIRLDASKLQPFGDQYPGWLHKLVCDLLSQDPKARPPLSACLSKLQALNEAAFLNWSCGICTLENEPSAPACVACGGPPPAGRVLLHDDAPPPPPPTGGGPAAQPRRVPTASITVQHGQRGAVGGPGLGGSAASLGSVGSAGAMRGANPGAGGAGAGAGAGVPRAVTAVHPAAVGMHRGYDGATAAQYSNMSLPAGAQVTMQPGLSVMTYHPAAMQQAPHVVRTEPWACPRCTLENAAAATMCVVCEAPAPPVQVASWTCLVCQVENDGHKRKCYLCDTPRGQARPSGTGRAHIEAQARALEELQRARGGAANEGAAGGAARGPAGAQQPLPPASAPPQGAPRAQLPPGADTGGQTSAPAPGLGGNGSGAPQEGQTFVSLGALTTGDAVEVGLRGGAGDSTPAFGRRAPTPNSLSPEPASPRNTADAVPDDVPSPSPTPPERDEEEGSGDDGAVDHSDAEEGSSSDDDAGVLALSPRANAGAGANVMSARSRPPSAGSASAMPPLRVPATRRGHMLDGVSAPLAPVVGASARATGADARAGVATVPASGQLPAGLALGPLPRRSLHGGQASPGMGDAAVRGSGSTEGTGAPRSRPLSGRASRGRGHRRRTSGASGASASSRPSRDPAAATLATSSGGGGGDGDGGVVEGRVPRTSPTATRVGGGTSSGGAPGSARGVRRLPSRRMSRHAAELASGSSPANSSRASASSSPRNGMGLSPSSNGTGLSPSSRGSAGRAGGLTGDAAIDAALGLLQASGNASPGSGSPPSRRPPSSGRRARAPSGTSPDARSGGVAATQGRSRRRSRLETGAQSSDGGAAVASSPTAGTSDSRNGHTPTAGQREDAAYVSSFTPLASLDGVSSPAGAAAARGSDSRRRTRRHERGESGSSSHARSLSSGQAAGESLPSQHVRTGSASRSSLQQAGSGSASAAGNSHDAMVARLSTLVGSPEADAGRNRAPTDGFIRSSAPSGGADSLTGLVAGELRRPATGSGATAAAAPASNVRRAPHTAATTGASGRMYAAAGAAPGSVAVRGPGPPSRVDTADLDDLLASVNNHPSRGAPFRHQALTALGSAAGQGASSNRRLGPQLAPLSRRPNAAGDSSPGGASTGPGSSSEPAPDFDLDF